MSQKNKKADSIVSKEDDDGDAGKSQSLVEDSSEERESSINTAKLAASQSDMSTLKSENRRRVK